VNVDYNKGVVASFRQNELLGAGKIPLRINARGRLPQDSAPKCREDARLTK